MTPRCNLHTHTTYCDGRNTAEQMILAAIEQGCETLGFSGHSPLAGESWTMRADQVDVYIAEIKSLKEKYKDRIEVVLGIELDTRSECDRSEFEYIIGSVHYVEKDGVYIPADADEWILRNDIDRCYGGNIEAYIRDYYESMCSLYEKTKCDIVGHFDLVTKFNEGNRFFDENDKKYQKTAIEALDHLIEKDLIFEMNTGAISRGYRKDPYPADFILRRLAEKGARVMLNSDTHSASTVFTHFKESTELAKACGIREFTVMKNGSFTEIPI